MKVMDEELVESTGANRADYAITLTQPLRGLLTGMINGIDHFTGLMVLQSAHIDATKAKKRFVKEAQRDMEKING